MITNFSKVYNEFPRRFWIIVLTSFIDSVGGTLLFPFFALFITQKFQIGMTQAGVILGLSSLSGLFGGIIGGAMTDKFGRRSIILFGLIFSALSSLAFGFTNNLSWLYVIAVVVGLLGSISGPAHGAMIADILPEAKRQEGFGILRVTRNMAWLVGPTVAGFVAARSFSWLFIIDAVISCIVAVIFYVSIPESKPAPHPSAEHESFSKTFTGYIRVLADKAYIAFIFASILTSITYQQMYNSLSVYLRDQHQIDPQGYGILLSTSAVVVILFQFWVTRQIKKQHPFVMMSLGALFYALGFALFGVFTTMVLFMTNIVIITMGEMIIMPTFQAVVAEFAPAEMRGRYMAIADLVWLIPSTVGPASAGYILDHYDPNLLWYIGGLLCVISAAGFLFLHARLGARPEFAPAQESSSAP